MYPGPRRAPEPRQSRPPGPPWLLMLEACYARLALAVGGLLALAAAVLGWVTTRMAGGLDVVVGAGLVGLGSVALGALVPFRDSARIAAAALGVVISAAGVAGLAAAITAEHAWAGVTVPAAAVLLFAGLVLLSGASVPAPASARLGPAETLPPAGALTRAGRVGGYVLSLIGVVTLVVAVSVSVLGGAPGRGQPTATPVRVSQAPPPLGMAGPTTKPAPSPTATSPTPPPAGSRSAPPRVTGPAPATARGRGSRPGTATAPPPATGPTPFPAQPPPPSPPVTGPVTGPTPPLREPPPQRQPSPQPAQAPPSATPRTPSGVNEHQTFGGPGRQGSDPAQVLGNYYAAINAHDYATAWRLGGKHFGGSYRQFVAGFSGTANDAWHTSKVRGNRVSGTLQARQTDGSIDLYRGWYAVSGGVLTDAHMTREQRDSSPTPPSPRSPHEPGLAGLPRFPGLSVAESLPLVVTLVALGQGLFVLEPSL